MAEINEERTSVAPQFLYQFTVGKMHSFFHLLVRDVKELYGLHYIIAEMPVEFLFYREDFLFGLFRE
jgi:hypothetical protein